MPRGGSLMDKPDYGPGHGVRGAGVSLNEGEWLRFARQMLLGLICFGGASPTGWCRTTRGQPDLRTGEDWRLALGHLGDLVLLPQ